jgi:hypothetical protein
MEDLRAPASGATDQEWDEFHAAIERRQAYAMWWNARGLSARVGCPAVAATPTVGCPLRPGTVELAHRAGLPIVTDPPEAGIAPTCCTARTVSVPVTAWGRVWQRYYWGSRDWRRAPAPRT